MLQFIVAAIAGKAKPGTPAKQVVVTPFRFYITEDSNSYYVTEDGLSNYITEN